MLGGLRPVREQMPDLRIFGPRSLRGAKNIAKRAGLRILLHPWEEHWLPQHVVAAIVATRSLASNSSFSIIGVPRRVLFNLGQMRLLLLPLAVFTASLWAQSNFATLSGSVEEPQKRPVSQGRVQLKSTSTGAVRKVVVNAEGLYEFAGLAPGEYELEAQATGFAALTRRVGIEVGQRMRLDLTLSIEATKRSLEVVSLPILLGQPCGPDRGRTLRPRVQESIEPEPVRAFQ